MNAPACTNILSLIFDTHQEYLAYVHANRAMLSQIWLWHETLGNREETVELPGVCDICNRQSIYRASTRAMPANYQFRFRAEWWIGLSCGCGVHALDRAVYRAFLDGGGRRDDQVYHVGQFFPFREWLAGLIPNVITSQYEVGREPGEIEDGIRYEDLTRLSFPDGQLDCVIAGEVLEHVADYKAALREMVRALKPGGQALMTFPWLGGECYEHRIRAEMLPDGSIHHIMPPEYHGDPSNPEGILSFRAFGWKILDEMREAGFRRARAKFLFGPLHGHMTLQFPVIVGER